MNITAQEMNKISHDNRDTQIKDRVDTITSRIKDVAESGQFSMSAWSGWACPYYLCIADVAVQEYFIKRGFRVTVTPRDFNVLFSNDWIEILWTDEVLKGEIT